MFTSYRRGLKSLIIDMPKGDGTRKAPGECNRNRVFRQYKDNARIRGLEFNLSITIATSLFQGDCFYCGSKPSRIMDQGLPGEGYRYNGIDRVDNSIGYIPDNCVSCCWRCNAMKSNMSKEEFLNQIHLIFSHVHIIS